MELGFLDKDKIYGILNIDMPLILGITIADQNLTRILVDKGSSCNVIYIGTMDLLGIQKTYLRLYNGGNMLAFNDYATHL